MWHVCTCHPQRLQVKHCTAGYCSVPQTPPSLPSLYPQALSPSMARIGLRFHSDTKSVWWGVCGHSYTFSAGLWFQLLLMSLNLNHFFESFDTLSIFLVDKRTFINFLELKFSCITLTGCPIINSL